MVLFFPFLGFNMKVVALALTLLLALGESSLLCLSHFAHLFRRTQDVASLRNITNTSLSRLEYFSRTSFFNLTVSFCPQPAMPAPCRPMLPPRWSTTRQLPWSTWTKWRTRPSRPWRTWTEETTSSISKPKIYSNSNSACLLRFVVKANQCNCCIDKWTL